MNNDPFELYDEMRKTPLISEMTIRSHWMYLISVLRMFDRSKLYQAIIERWAFTGKEWEAQIDD